METELHRKDSEIRTWQVPCHPASRAAHSLPLPHLPLQPKQPDCPSSPPPPHTFLLLQSYYPRHSPPPQAPPLPFTPSTALTAPALPCHVRTATHHPQAQLPLRSTLITQATPDSASLPSCVYLINHRLWPHFCMSGSIQTPTAANTIPAVWTLSTREMHSTGLVRQNAICSVQRPG